MCISCSHISTDICSAILDYFTYSCFGFNTAAYNCTFTSNLKAHMCISWRNILTDMRLAKLDFASNLVSALTLLHSIVPNPKMQKLICLYHAVTSQLTCVQQSSTISLNHVSALTMLHSIVPSPKMQKLICAYNAITSQPISVQRFLNLHVISSRLHTAVYNCTYT